MKHFYVEFKTKKTTSGWGWTTVDAPCEYDAKIIVHNALYIPLDDIYTVSEMR